MLPYYKGEYMISEVITLPSIILAGISVRTNNSTEMSAQGKIGPLMNQYFNEQIASKISNRIAPGKTYSLYTEFESDENGDYTYFIGEEVSFVEDKDLSDLKIITIPESKYQKFTTQEGEMPAIVIDGWKQIWAMKSTDFAGLRKYVADFEIYDKNFNPIKDKVDIYVGIQDIK